MCRKEIFRWKWLLDVCIPREVSAVSPLVNEILPQAKRKTVIQGMKDVFPSVIFQRLILLITQPRAERVILQKTHQPKNTTKNLVHQILKYLVQSVEKVKEAETKKRINGFGWLCSITELLPPSLRHTNRLEYNIIKGKQFW